MTQRRCFSCGEVKDCRSVDVEGFDEGFYCQECYMKWLDMIDFLKENEPDLTDEECRRYMMAIGAVAEGTLELEEGLDVKEALRRFAKE
jgi:hypothetical protein